MKRTVLALVLALALSGCAGQQKKIHHYPDHAIGQQMATLFVTIVERNGYSSTDVRYCIWDNPEVNAWMTSENTLIISTGLLNLLIPEGNYRREQTLVSVIAHEVAHYRLGHIAKKQNVNMATDIGVTATLLTVELMTGIPVGLAGYIITPTITSAYSRSQELEADREAVNILQTAKVLEPAKVYAGTLEWFDAKKTNVQDWGLWNTHPSASERIKSVLSDVQ